MREVTLNPANGQIMKTPVGPQLALPMDVEQAGEILTYKIQLPYLPPSKNVYDGWPMEWKSSHKKKWMRYIQKKATELQMPKAEKIGLSAVLVFSSARQRDPQNYSNCLWNFVPDALQKAGVIDGDHEGKIQIGRNWGIRMAVDKRQAPKNLRERTHLAITMLVKP